MRNQVITFFLFITCLSACRVSNEHEGISADLVVPADGVEPGGIEFETEVFDFGTISQGEKVEFEFKFKSTGENPLVLSSVKASCGCTVTEGWPKEPLAPGETGIIPVKFDSRDKKGRQSKSITVLTNADPKTRVLYLEGEVVAPGGLNDIQTEPNTN